MPRQLAIPCDAVAWAGAGPVDRRSTVACTRSDPVRPRAWERRRSPLAFADLRALTRISANTSRRQERGARLQ
jgi:hypothetical protein